MENNKVLTILLGNQLIPNNMDIPCLKFEKWTEIGLEEIILPKIQNRRKNFNLRICCSGIENRLINSCSDQILRILPLNLKKATHFFSFSSKIQFFKLLENVLPLNITFKDDKNEYVKFEDDKEIVLTFRLKK